MYLIIDSGELESKKEHVFTYCFGLAINSDMPISVMAIVNELVSIENCSFKSQYEWSNFNTHLLHNIDICLIVIRLLGLKGNSGEQLILDRDRIYQFTDWHMYQENH